MALILENMREMSLKELATPTLGDLEAQRLNLEPAANTYELKLGTIRIAVENPFSGVETDNPYKHLEKFEQICNTFQQEGVPTTWFKWNLFPFTLVDQAKRWHSTAVNEAKGNWNLLVKKFVQKFFPPSKVHKLTQQVWNFKQEENEDIDDAWERFNNLFEQGPKLGMSVDLALRIFYYSLKPATSTYVNMCSGGALIDLTTTEAARVISRICMAAQDGKEFRRATQSEKIQHEVVPKLEVAPKLEAAHKQAPVQSVEMFDEEYDHPPAQKTVKANSLKPEVERKKEVGRTLANARPLTEFETMDRIPIDFGESISCARPFPSQIHLSARAIEESFPPREPLEDFIQNHNTREMLQKSFQENDEELDEDFVLEVKRVMGVKPDSSPFEKLAKVYAINASKEDNESTPRIICSINGEVFYNTLCDMGSQVSIMSYEVFFRHFKNSLKLAPTSVKLIMGDGRINKPLGLIENVDVLISEKPMPTDFYVINVCQMMG